MGVEPTTCRLRDGCSSVELRQRNQVPRSELTNYSLIQTRTAEPETRNYFWSLRRESNPLPLVWKTSAITSVASQASS